MFDPKTLVQGAVSRAPGFILAKPGGIIDGLIGATLTMAFWCSRSGWISTFFSVVVCVAAAYGVGRVLDIVIPIAIRAVDPSFIAAAAATTAPLPTAAPSGDSELLLPSSQGPARLASGSQKGGDRSRGKQSANQGEKLD